MKKLPLILFSLFFLNSSSVFSDELSDFEVLGMSIGDSLLDFMPEVDILYGIEKYKNSNRYSYLKEPHKFLEITVPGKKNYLYDGAEVFIKNTVPQNFTIHAIRAHTVFIEDFDACIKRRNQIVEILTNFFPDAKTGSLIDEDNEGIIDNFSLGNSERIIDVNCLDVEETYRLNNNSKEGLELVIRNKEFSDWALNSK